MKSKLVSYECTWRLCNAIVPESDDRIKKQIETWAGQPNVVVRCPECGSPMQRKVTKKEIRSMRR